MKNIKISKDDLIILYIDLKSIHKVGKELNVSGNTISRWLKFYSIKVLNDPKRFSYIKDKSFTDIQNQFIVGSMLGDGNIDFSRGSARLRFCHGSGQIEYLKWKKEILGDLVQQDIGIYTQKERNSTAILIQTIQHQEFEKYYEKFYYNGKKVIPKDIQNILTPFGLAVWYMDDGSKIKDSRGLVLCTDSFSTNENLLLVDVLKNKFNIISNLRNSSNRICIYGDEVDKFFDLIKDYIIPSMHYKLEKYER